MKVCLQAGHKGTYVGATGAPGERDWNSKIVPLISNILTERGCEVYQTDANGWKDAKVIDTDWDLFLAIHYDADIYNDRGGFVDFPDPSVDHVTQESQRICKIITDHYFKTTAIPYRPSRSNANTKFYYMWQYLTANTPCNLIECGVGWRKPEDYETLHNHIDVVAKAIADGISLALGIDIGMTDCEKKLAEVTELMIKYKQERDDKDRKLEECRIDLAKAQADAKEHIEQLQKSISELNQINSSLMKDKADLQVEIATLRSEVIECQENEDALKLEVESLIDQKTKLAAEFTQISGDMSECQKKLGIKLCKYSFLEFLKAKVRCGK